MGKGCLLLEADRHILLRVAEGAMTFARESAKSSR